MVRQHVRFGFRHDPPSDAGTAQGKGFKVVCRQQQVMENLGGVNRKLPHPFSAKNFFIRLADQVRQRKQGFSESFKDYMIDMQTMVST